MFVMITSIVLPSSSVGLNSTGSHPALPKHTRPLARTLACARGAGGEGELALAALAVGPAGTHAPRPPHTRVRVGAGEEGELALAA